MGLRCGIIGVPNAGKSTLFNALTNSRVATENYPFCTIDPNISSAPVPDFRLRSIADLVQVETLVPALLEFVDIAGLVEGASQGEGLGNRFLSHIREVDLIIQVIAAFDSERDWQSDYEVIQIELILSDLEIVQRAIERTARRARIGDKKQIRRLSVLEEIESRLSSGKTVSSFEGEIENLQLIDDVNLITSKPQLLVFNVSEDQLSNFDIDEEIETTSPKIVLCAQLEAELSQLPADERELFREELSSDISALEHVVRSGYEILGLNTFFTYNSVEVRAWPFGSDATAAQAAGMVHSDMEKGFIKAAVMSYDDLQSYGSEQAVKNAGRIRFEGRSYKVQEGEIIRIYFHN